jgi:hypothetical protein
VLSPIFFAPQAMAQAPVENEEAIPICVAPNSRHDGAATSFSFVDHKLKFNNASKSAAFGNRK